MSGLRDVILSTLPPTLADVAAAAMEVLQFSKLSSQREIDLCEELEKCGEGTSSAFTSKQWPFLKKAFNLSWMALHCFACLYLKAYIFVPKMAPRWLTLI